MLVSTAGSRDSEIGSCFLSISAILSTIVYDEQQVLDDYVRIQRGSDEKYVRLQDLQGLQVAIILNDQLGAGAKPDICLGMHYHATSMWVRSSPAVSRKSAHVKKQR